MKISPGEVYCQLGAKKRFHIFVYVQDYKGRLLFFDIHTGEIFLITAKTFECVINKTIMHPVHNDLRMFDFIEHLPDDVFNVIKADTELKLKDKEPEILDLF